MIILLKATKNRASNTLKITFLKKPQWGVKLTSSLFRVKKYKFSPDFHRTSHRTPVLVIYLFDEIIVTRNHSHSVSCDYYELKYFETFGY